MDNDPSTLGIEFESVIATRENVLSNLSKGGRNLIGTVTRDASVESVARFVGERSSLFLGNSSIRSMMLTNDVKVMGYEIVTLPLELTAMRRVITQTINTQIKMGEIFSERSSIHIHTGFPCGLIFLKVAVAMGLKVEPLLYKIAGMGNSFRGIVNGSAYCRPLALPPAIRLSNSPEFAVLNPTKAIDADGEDKFWGYFGITPRDRDRYTPLRYIGMNVYSTLLRGTMEYRFFNFTGVGKYVESVAGLVQFISDLIIRLPVSVVKNIPGLSIFKHNSNQDYNDLLNELIRLGEYYRSELPIADRDLEVIRELIDITPQPVFENKVILSHLRQHSIHKQTAIDFDLDIVNRADEPGIIDIHNFGKLNRQLIGE